MVSEIFEFIVQTNSSDSKKEILSFVGKSFAKAGFRFYFSHVPKSCTDSCSLFNTCQNNLKMGEIYRITEVQDKSFRCPSDLHEEEMVLCRLIEEPIFITIPTRMVIEGGSIRLQLDKCPHENCKYYEYCLPEFRVKDGDKVKILKRIEKVDNCKLGKILTVVHVDLMPEK